MNILVIDNYDSFTYNLVHLVRSFAPDAVDVFRNDKFLPEDISRYDKIIFSPGPGIPDEAPLMNALIQSCASSKSILGICLGHQAIASYYGAQLINMKEPRHGVTTDVHVTDPGDYMFEGLPESFEAGLYHSWAVDKESCRMIIPTAVDRHGGIMALKHPHHDHRGLQFHPESVMTPVGKKIIENWLRHPIHKSTTTETAKDCAL